MSVPYEKLMFPGQEVTSAEEEAARSAAGCGGGEETDIIVDCSTGACIGVEVGRKTGALRIVDVAGGVAVDGFGVDAAGLRDLIQTIKDDGFVRPPDAPPVA